MKMYQNDALKCLTGEVRLSYANLCTPRANNPGEDPKYSVTLLIPKTDIATKADLDASIEAAAQDGMQRLWNGVRPPMMRTPIHDGDGVKENGEPYGEECRGHWVLNASSKQKPDVVHSSNLNVQLSPGDVYSGMYARVTIRFFAYASSGNRGVGCGLGNVMKIREGEPLSGKSSALNDFKGLEQPIQPMPPQYIQPTQTQQPQTYQTQVQQPHVDPITDAPIGNMLGLLDIYQYTS